MRKIFTALLMICLCEFGFAKILGENNISENIVSEMILEGEFNKAAQKISENPNLSSEVLLNLIFTYPYKNSEAKQNINRFIGEHKFDLNHLFSDNGEDITIFYLLILMPINIDEKIELMETIIKNGYDLSKPVVKSDEYTLSPLAVVIQNEEHDSEHFRRIFDFLVDKKASPDMALNFLLNKKIGANIDEFNKTQIDEIDKRLKSAEFAKNRQKYQPWVDEIFDNYELSDFDGSEVFFTAYEYILMNDFEGLQKLIDKGFKEIPGIVAHTINESPKNRDEILKLLQ